MVTNSHYTPVSDTDARTGIRWGPSRVREVKMTLPLLMPLFTRAFLLGIPLLPRKVLFTADLHGQLVRLCYM